MSEGPTLRGRATLIGALALIHGVAHAATEPAPAADRRVDEILRVTQDPPAPTREIDGGETSGAVPDAARTLAALPGVAVNGNGPLSGQIQIRGLQGPRLGVRVDGLTMVSGGPNWMDPPMHYVPSGLLHRAAVSTGPASQSAGGGFGGAVAVETLRPAWNETDAWTPRLQVDGSAASVDDGWGTSVLVGLASDTQRLHASASRESGDDRDGGDGTLVPTAYERRSEGLGWGLRTDRFELDAGWRRVQSDDSGTPVLPLDIEFFDTTLWHLDGRLATGFGAVTAFLGSIDVEHAMNNVGMRTTPDFSSLPLPPFAGPDARRVRASAEGREARLGVEVDLGPARLRGGVDWRSETHDARVLDPDFAPFFVTNFDDAGSTSLAGWGEFTTRLDDRTRLRAGMRLVHTDSEADPVDAFPARLVDANPAAWPAGTPPRAVFVLRQRSAEIDRDRTDVTLDWDLRLTRVLGDGLAAQASVARRTRVPDYFERWLWIPLEVNGGLGDGNAWVGDPDLDAEVSHQIEVGLSWAGEATEASLQVHYRRVDDYVLGVPVTDPVTIAVAGGASGDATPLRFANVDAHLWGLDASVRREFAGGLAVDAAASWLDGERRDVDDGLYRLAPPDLTLGLDWSRGAVTVRLEQELVARRSAGSKALTLDPGNASNRFADVPGYGLTHADLRWQPTSALDLRLGVRNLFDRAYTDPLAGFSRAVDGDATVGERLPGDGRNIYARVRWTL